MTRFTKADLKPMDIVKFREGVGTCMVFENSRAKETGLSLFSENGYCFLHLDAFTDDLLNKRYSCSDIIAVYRPTSENQCNAVRKFFQKEHPNDYEWTWERKYVIKAMAMEEIEYTLGYPVKIVK